jgi:HK97 family phage prohead protease
MDTKPFSFKSLTTAPEGRFVGQASVYDVVDSYGDKVVRGAFTKTIAKHGGEIVILSQHNPSDPIGKAKLFDRHDALWIEGQLELELPSAREAYIRLKKGLVDGISIGYNTLRSSPGKGGIRLLEEIDLWEVSIVTFPANGRARVTDVKGGTLFEANELLEGLQEIRLRAQGDSLDRVEARLRRAEFLAGLGLFKP